jgi:hypothetical protein
MGTAYAKVKIEATSVKIRVYRWDTPAAVYHRALCKALQVDLVNVRCESWNADAHYMEANDAQNGGPVYWKEERAQKLNNMVAIERAILRAST